MAVSTENDVKIKEWTPLMDVLVQEYGLVTAAVFGVAWRHWKMKQHVCKAARDRMAKLIGLKRATLNRHLAILVRDGYLQDLTPGKKNKPHAYVVTGKARLQIEISATVAQSNSKKTRSPDEHDGTIDGDKLSTVAESNSHCDSVQHPTVAESHMEDTCFNKHPQERRSSPSGDGSLKHTNKSGYRNTFIDVNDFGNYLVGILNDDGEEVNENRLIMCIKFWQELAESNGWYSFNVKAVLDLVKPDGLEKRFEREYGFTPDNWIKEFNLEVAQDTPY